MKHRVYSHEFLLGLEDVYCLADVTLVRVRRVLADIKVLCIVIGVLGRVCDDVGIVRVEAGPPCDDVGYIIVELYIHCIPSTADI